MLQEVLWLLITQCHRPSDTNKPNKVTKINLNLVFFFPIKTVDDEVRLMY